MATCWPASKVWSRRKRATISDRRGKGEKRACGGAASADPREARANEERVDPDLYLPELERLDGRIVEHRREHEQRGNQPLARIRLAHRRQAQEPQDQGGKGEAADRKHSEIDRVERIRRGQPERFERRQIDKARRRILKLDLVLEEELPIEGPALRRSQHAQCLVHGAP